MNDLRFEVIPSLNGVRGGPFTVTFPQEQYLDQLLAEVEMRWRLEVATLKNQLEEARHALEVATRPRWWRRKNRKR